LISKFLLKGTFKMVDIFRVKFTLKLVFVLFFTGCFNSVTSKECEKQEIDSLVNVTIDQKVNNLDRVDSYLILSKCYSYTNLDSAQIFVEQGIELAEEIAYTKGLAIGFLRQGEIYNINGQIEEAKSSIHQALVLYENLKKDKEYMIACNMLAFQYENQSNYDKALEYYLNGLRVAEELNNQTGKAYFYNNISNIYSNTGLHNESLNYILKASSIFIDIGDSVYYANSLINLGRIYQNLNNLDSAIYYFNKAEGLETELNNYYGLIKVNKNLGDIASKRLLIDEAHSYYLNAMHFAMQLDSLNPYKKIELAGRHKDLGNVYILLQDYENALKHLNHSLRFGLDNNSISLMKDSYWGLFTCYEAMNQTDSALYFHKLLLSVNDSLQAELYNETINQMNYEYRLEVERELHNKEQKLVILEKNRQELVYLVIVGILFIVALTIFIIWYFQKTKLLKSELKRKNLHLEKENISNDLDKKNRELTASVLNLIERNEFLAKISEKLQNQKLSGESEGDANIEEIVRSIDKEGANSLWKEFELRYMEVHKDFHQKLTSKYPDLTPNERKLCAFIVLNMSTKDISSITYQSIHSIKIARYRLRKKLGLEKNENLTSFLHNL